MTSLKRCSCEHTYQDRKYGRKNRVHNKAASSSGKDGWKCTVCGDKK